LCLKKRSCVENPKSIFERGKRGEMNRLPDLRGRFFFCKKICNALSKETSDLAERALWYKKEGKQKISDPTGRETVAAFEMTPDLGRQGSDTKKQAGKRKNLSS